MSDHKDSDVSQYEIKQVDQYLDKARALVTTLESENNQQAQTILQEITDIQQSEMYQELGKLTRSLHDIINGFELDSKLSHLTSTEIPDATDRLNHVIKLTDEAAHKTLSLVEESLPICEDMADKTTVLGAKWNRFIAKDMSAEQFRALVKEITEFMMQCSVNNNVLRDNLNEVLMSQGFQDLTGQTIKKVIALVQDIQDCLVAFIKFSSGSGSRLVEEKGREETDDSLKAEGPYIDGVDKGNAVKSQDEVDDLLSSLGF